MSRRSQRIRPAPHARAHPTTRGGKCSYLIQFQNQVGCVSLLRDVTRDTAGSLAGQEQHRAAAARSDRQNSPRPQQDRPFIYGPTGRPGKGAGAGGDEGACLENRAPMSSAGPAPSRNDTGRMGRWLVQGERGRGQGGLWAAGSGVLGDEFLQGDWIGPHELVDALAFLEEEECRHGAAVNKTVSGRAGEGVQPIW